MDNRRNTFDIKPDDMFKKALMISFKKIIVKKHLLKESKIDFFSLQDWESFIGINGTIGITSAIVTTLAATSVIGAIFIPVIIIPAACASIGIGVGIGLYRTHENKANQKAIGKLVNKMDLEKWFEAISDTLSNLYKDNINNMTEKSINQFAAMITKMIMHAILEGKVQNANDLIDRPKLHSLLLSLRSPYKNQNLNEIINHEIHHKAYSYISKSAIYTETEGNVYQSNKTNTEKYGLVAFRNHDELNAFQAITQNPVYQSVPVEKSNELIVHSIFNADIKNPNNGIKKQQHTKKIISKIYGI